MNRCPGKLLFIVALATASFLPFPAVAFGQETGARLDGGRGLDLHLFRPAVDSKGLFTVNGSDVLGHLDFSFGLILDAGIGLLPASTFVNDEGAPIGAEDRQNRLVDSFFTGTLTANLGLFDLLVVGVQVPVQVVSGANTTLPATGGSTGYNSGEAGGLDYQGLGDLTVHGKLRLTRVERDPVGLAALVLVEVPTGSPSEFAGDGFALWPMMALEARPHRLLRLAVNVGYRMNFGDPATIPVGARTVPTGSTGGMNALGAMIDPAQPGVNTEYGHLITFGAGAALRVADSVELGLEAYGAQSVAAFHAEGFSLEAILGLKVFVEQNSYLVLGGGVGIPNIASDSGGLMSADVRGMLGFIFEPSIGDRDGDGLKDDFDQCPDEPEDFDNFADEDGCPDPDNDRDGILDVDDGCPLVPEDRDGDADEDGCPEGNEGDRDGDGLLDEVDGCPDDPEDRDGFQDEDGCPDVDNDQDGILDVDDLCPDDPEDRDDFEDLDGCPDPDNDADRILDVDDACPNDPETYNGYQDEDGCPDRHEVDIEGGVIVTFRKIMFETDSAHIVEDSLPILDAVAAAMNGNPQIELVEIQGHADERSSDDYNIRLTRDRAAAVREGLVQRGVRSERLRSAGYGERCPLDHRHNARAWEANRRVEFKILRQDGTTSTAEVVCAAGRELVPE
ncbi:MAG: OmpA family protein [Deltaproteobacteria bacterium]|nr:MAG: OmpA family protein [Deltaproteobacteria bacterium]